MPPDAGSNHRTVRHPLSALRHRRDDPHCCPTALSLACITTGHLMTYRRPFAPIYQLAVARATYATGVSLQRQAAIFSLSAAAFHYAFFSGPCVLVSFSPIRCHYLALTIIFPLSTPSASTFNTHNRTPSAV